MFPVEKYKFIHSLVRRVAVYESEVRLAVVFSGKPGTVVLHADHAAVGGFFRLYGDA